MLKVCCRSAVLGALALSAAFVAAACGSRSSAQPTFSNASIKGGYALSFAVAIGGGTSTNFAGGTGVIVADGGGNLTAPKASASPVAQSAPA